MGQLIERQAREIYPETSMDTYFYGHALNEERNIGRLVTSVQKVLTPKVIVIGIDDRTTDETEKIAKDLGAHTFKFKWEHHFSVAKNKCVAECIRLGMKQGDIEACSGIDWEWHSYDKTFFEDPNNFFASVKVTEFEPDQQKKTFSNRALISRHASQFFWQKPAHETKTGRAYLLTCKGILDSDTPANRAFPVIAEASHYGLEKKGGRNGERFLRDSWYYTILVSLWDLSFRTLQPCENGNDLMNLIRYAYNNPNLEDGLDHWIKEILKRCMNGDAPKGLSSYRDHYKKSLDQLENNL